MKAIYNECDIDVRKSREDIARPKAEKRQSYEVRKWRYKVNDVPRRAKDPKGSKDDTQCCGPLMLHTLFRELGTSTIDSYDFPHNEGLYKYSDRAIVLRVISQSLLKPMFVDAVVDGGEMWHGGPGGYSLKGFLRDWFDCDHMEFSDRLATNNLCKFCDQPVLANASYFISRCCFRLSHNWCGYAHVYNTCLVDLKLMCELICPFSGCKLPSFSDRQRSSRKELEHGLSPLLIIPSHRLCGDASQGSTKTTTLGYIPDKAVGVNLLLAKRRQA